MSATQALTLVVGLRNPTARYAKTRHNAGAWVVDALVEHYGGRFKPVRSVPAEVAELRVSGRAIHVLKSTTWMNDSGRAVGAYARYRQASPEQLLVVHDELDLPVGTVRLKHGGGHGGHNGLRDVFAHLHSRDFWRLRLGIGHPGCADEVADYVLKAPSASEREALSQVCVRVAALWPELLSADVDFDAVTRQLHNH